MVNNTVSGRALAITLIGVRELTGAQFENTLIRAGLSRFSNNMPSIDDESMVAGRADLAKLYEAIFTICGEVVFRLFLRNLGHKMSQQAIPLASVQQARVAVRKLASEVRLIEGVKIVCALLSQQVENERLVTSDEKYVYIIATDCIYCQGIKNKTTKPICEILVKLYNDLIREVTGFYQLSVIESACAASGDPQCILRMSKI